LTGRDPRAEHRPPMNTQLTHAIVRIREMILRGELAPGQRVAEAPLADLLGVSRTPVRQALPLLAQEGLLSEHETRGYVVRAFTAEDIVDAIDLRGALEGLAIRKVTESGALPRRYCGSFAPASKTAMPFSASATSRRTTKACMPR
jgi:DNA-binding GntR family transcriptional regulator